MKHNFIAKWNAYGPNEQFWWVFDRSRFLKLRKQNGWYEMRRVEDYRECRLRIRVRIYFGSIPQSMVCLHRFGTSDWSLQSSRSKLKARLKITMNYVGGCIISAS